MIATTETQTDAPAGDIRARNKEVIFAALAEACIHRVTVDYDGSGDSGQIESIEAWNAANERIPFPSDPRIPLVFEGPEQLRAEINLESAVESLTWDYLYDLHDGWENNDGAFGTFVFDIPARSITLEHHERFTDFNTYSHEF